MTIIEHPGSFFLTELVALGHIPCRAILGSMIKNTCMPFGMYLHHAFNWKMNAEFSKQTATQSCISLLVLKYILAILYCVHTM